MTNVDLTPAPASSGGSSLRRILGLARANAVLLTRNRITLAYALVLPLIPLAMLLVADRGDETAGMSALANVLLLAMLFPVYYNLLSLTVTRRDELVLKRFRTGEVTDRELLASMALPGFVVIAVVFVLTIAAAVALGQPVPANLAVMAVAVAIAAVCFAGLAFWTAAQTKNAEAAQLTSMPVIIVAVLGSLRPLFSERIQQIVDWTPGAAIDALVRVGWFGVDRDSGAELGLAETFTHAAQPLVVLAVWAVLAGWLTSRSMRWEPRG